MPTPYYGDASGTKQALPVTRHHHDSSYARVNHRHDIDSGWILAPLANGWIPYGGSWAYPAYRLLGGVVYLKGLAKKDDEALVGGSTTLMFTLPVGFRPLERHIFIGGNQHSASGIYTHAQRVDIAADGQVLIAYPNDTDGYTWQSFTGISFIAEQ